MDRLDIFARRSEEFPASLRQQFVAEAFSLFQGTAKLLALLRRERSGLDACGFANHGVSLRLYRRTANAVRLESATRGRRRPAPRLTPPRSPAPRAGCWAASARCPAPAPGSTSPAPAPPARS